MSSSYDQLSCKKTSYLLILFLLHLLLKCPRKCNLFSLIVPLSFLVGTMSLRYGSQVSTFYLLLFQSLLLLHTLSNKLIQSPFFLLCIVIDLELTNLCRQRDQDQVHELSSNNSNFSVLSLVTRLDISIMYSLIFFFPLYRIETSLLRILFVSTFSFAANRFAIWFKNVLSQVS